MATPPRIDDPGYVRDEYADDARLSARIALWAARSGPQPQDIALERIVEMNPVSALEVGCGQGAFAAALKVRGIEVTAIDQSERMVLLAESRGVSAQRADVQNLPFCDHAFDVVAANYMLYHVPDLPRAFSEIARVLRPGGALVAVANSERQLAELWGLVGRQGGEDARVFGSENGAGILATSFAQVEQIDVEERFVITEEAARDYIWATRFPELADRLAALPDGLTVTAAGSVFIATTLA
jgi:SAM-dependent methyltransferase